MRRNGCSGRPIIRLSWPRERRIGCRGIRGLSRPGASALSNSSGSSSLSLLSLLLSWGYLMIVCPFFFFLLHHIIIVVWCSFYVHYHPPYYHSQPYRPTTWHPTTILPSTVVIPQPPCNKELPPRYRLSVRVFYSFFPWLLLRWQRR